MPRLLRLCACAIVGAAVVFAAWWAARPADPAPAAVAATEPADGATLTRPPAEIEMSVTAPVDPARSHVSVRDGSGAAVDSGRPRLITATRLRQPVAITTAGDVAVAYHLTFADGAQLTGTLTFSVTTGGRTAAEPGATGEPAHRHGIDPVSAILLLIDGLVVLVAVALLARRPGGMR